MAFLSGHSMPTMGFSPGAASPQAAANPGAVFDGANGRPVIDGTPVRIVVLALAAATGLTVLKLSGFRFNVGVSA